MLASYSVDVCRGEITLKRNGVPMRTSGAFPQCYCCHPNDRLWQQPPLRFASVEEAWRAADNDRSKPRAK